MQDYKKHQLNIFPKITSDDYKRLYNDIKENGYDEREPIYLFEGKILDGWSRYNICQELDVEPSFEEFKGSRLKALNYVLRTNKRRNLTSSQWASIAVEADDLIGELEQKAKDNQGTRIDLKDDDIPEEIPESKTPEKRETRTKLAKFYNTNPHYISDVKGIKKEDPAAHKKIKKGEKTITEYNREKKKAERKERIKSKSAEFKKTSDKIEIHQGDFQEVTNNKIEDNSIDHIITDPPYPEDFLPEWSKLSKVANRVLKPGGFCISYSGKYHLPEVISRLSENLEYYWQLILLHQGSSAGIYPRNINTGYKPILVFAKPPIDKQEEFITDIIEGSGKEKDLHEWQQGEEELKQVLDRFTEPNDLILDPFAGSGTIPYSCLKNNRKSIAIEKDKETCKTLKGRIAQIIK